MRKTLYICLSALFSLLGMVNAFAQTNLKIVKPGIKSETVFAVFVDSESFEACKNEMMEYKNVLESEGLGTYILSAQWNKPEDVKGQIAKLASGK